MQAYRTYSLHMMDRGWQTADRSNRPPSAVCRRALRRHHNLPTLPARHRRDGLLELVEAIVMRDDGREVDGVRAQQSAHLEPRLPQLAPDHALHADAFEDDEIGEVEFEGRAGQTEQRRRTAELEQLE